MNRDMLSRRLRRKGFDVEMAHDGRRGLTAARSGLFDLILMDLSLPGLDGWTVARLLKNDPITKVIPIMALTAHAMSGDRERALEAGCDDYDTKPIDFPRLIAKIETLLSDVSGFSSNRQDEIDLTELPFSDDLKIAANLRHDMINPIGRIFGYCDLRIEDADIQSKVYRSHSLKAVRVLGEVARRSIDRVLLHWDDPKSGHTVDFGSLYPGVLPPAHAIINACDAIEEASRQDSDFDSFLEDLGRIREDAALLISLAWQAKDDTVRIGGQIEPEIQSAEHFHANSVKADRSLPSLPAGA